MIVPSPPRNRMGPEMVQSSDSALHARLSNIEHELMMTKQQHQQQQRHQISHGGPLYSSGAELQAMRHQNEMASLYQDLVKQHTELMKKHAEFIRGRGTATMPQAGSGVTAMTPQAAGSARAIVAASRSLGGNKKKAVCLGIIRLDYDYPPAPGDIDHEGSFAYDVIYRVVPGLTFKMCQSGEMTPSVQREFLDAIDYLEAKKVTGITGDCGFMMYFQALARRNTTKPVFMSSLAQLPAIICCYSKYEMIAVFTANAETLRPMRNLVRDECGVDPEEKRFIIVGCQDVPGFEAVALGEKVDVAKVTPGMIKKAKDVLDMHPKIRCIVLECTELPPYADALRASTGLPVYDAITGCNYFMSGRMDNKRFGLNDWQQGWDGVHNHYKYGGNLTAEQKAMLVNHAA